MEQAVAKIIQTERKACALIEEIQNKKNSPGIKARAFWEIREDSDKYRTLLR